MSHAMFCLRLAENCATSRSRILLISTFPNYQITFQMYFGCTCCFNLRYRNNFEFRQFQLSMGRWLSIEGLFSCFLGAGFLAYTFIQRCRKVQIEKIDTFKDANYCNF